MTGRNKWSETRDSRLANEKDRARYEKARERLEEALEDHEKTLKQLRLARNLTQQQLAEVMRVSQAQVSRVENQTDLYLSTLRSYVQAMGGELHLSVSFPGGEQQDISIDEIVHREEKLSETGSPLQENSEDEVPVAVEEGHTLASISTYPVGSYAAGTVTSQFVPSLWSPSVPIISDLARLTWQLRRSLRLEAPHTDVEIHRREGAESAGRQDFFPPLLAFSLGTISNVSDPLKTRITEDGLSVLGFAGNLVVPEDEEKFISSAPVRES